MFTVLIIEQIWQQFPTGHFVKHLKKPRIQRHGKMLQACNCLPSFTYAIQGVQIQKNKKNENTFVLFQHHEFNIPLV